ncbi:hypothetical protein Hanom_Chr10g00939601 [Helianthus anomalus]
MVTTDSLNFSDLASDLVAGVCSDLMKRMRMKMTRVSSYEDDANGGCGWYWWWWLMLVIEVVDGCSANIW